MAEAEDKDGKTEEPTDHKIKQAIEKGNVPLSRELATLASLMAAMAMLAFLASGPGAHLTRVLAQLLGDAGALRLETDGDAAAILGRVALQAGLIVIPAVLLLAAAGLASSLIQNTPKLVLERIRPQASRLSPGSGLKRIFGMRGLVEFAKSLFKLIAVSGVALIYLNAIKGEFLSAMYREPERLPQTLFVVAVKLLLVITAMSLALAAADWAWSRFSWRRDLRMTKQEIKDEMKQMDGDPAVKAKRKALARDRARRRMMAAVPRATVVIANPTHYAVALRYERAEGGAPLVLAKGRDLIALKIREIAEANGIAVIEDRPLARALHDAVEVDRMIPPEFYQAVAKIILFLNSRGQARGALAGAAPGFARS